MSLFPVGTRRNADVFLPSSRANLAQISSDRITTMRRNPRFCRLTAAVALTALLGHAVLPPMALAQPAPPPLPQPYASQPKQSETDPPARVGRIARITGTFSFHNRGDIDWSQASANYPVSAGNAFWTEPGSTAELEISGSRIVLAATTEFEVATLDGNGLQAVAAQGEAYLHLRDLSPNEAWSVQTPRGLVRFSGPGRYGIVAGSTEQPTLVTVLEGSAEVVAPGVSLQVASGQTATIEGIGTFQGTLGPALRDPFLASMLDGERPPPPVRIPAPVAAMPGGRDLAGYGNWAPEPEYGQVWYPPVAPEWVPYRQGRWAYVAPWGWTWIDDAPWGFAPFHYGRWVEIGERWAWTPGRYAGGPPVYAPALVTFIGIGAGAGIGAALAAGSIGWVPLGPHEPFYPWYRASDRYRQEINVSHTTNFNGPVNIDLYTNRRAATAMPRPAMAASRPVQSVVQPLTPQQFSGARPIVGQQPIRPTAATSGITSVAARQFQLDRNVHPAPGPAVRVPAPGPAMRAPAPGSAVAGLPHPGAIIHGPGLYTAGGSPPIHSSVQAAPLGLPRPGVLPSGTPAPHVGRPAEIPPAIVRPEPAFVRPGVTLPHAESRPLPLVATLSRPEPLHPAMPRVEQPQHIAQPLSATRPEPPHFAPAAAMPRFEQHLSPPSAIPRPEPLHPAVPRVEQPQHIAPPAGATRPEPPRFAPAAAMPRVEQQHFSPPPAMPRPEPQHFAPPAPRPEPPRAAAPAPPIREKRPGER